MSRDDAQLEKLLEQALSMTSDARLAFLNDQCGTDTALRREIDQLLAHHESAEQDSFLEGDDSGPLHKALHEEDAARVDQTQAFVRSNGASTSTGLLDRIRAKDEDAWSYFVDLYGPLVYSWCRRYDLNSADAADLVQQIFTSVFTGLNNFRRDGVNQRFRAWLWTISRNKIIDHFRTRKERGAGGTSALQRLQQTPEHDVFASTLSLADGKNSIARRALELAESEFNAKTIQAFMLTAVEQLNATEAGERLGMTAVAVRQAKSRVLRRVREMLADIL